MLRLLVSKVITIKVADYHSLTKSLYKLISLATLWQPLSTIFDSTNLIIVS